MEINTNQIKELNPELLYFLNPVMIKFLLVENLALKTLLHEKGLIDPEEYKQYQNKATEVLEVKIKNDLMKKFSQS